MNTGGLNAIELFAGVGGFRLGLERAGHHVIWANEWDKYACDVYDYNFRADRIVRGDIRAVDAADIPARDLIVGGFPCQAFSVAGKRRGFEDTRGTLFFEIARIATHHRTPYLLLENVKGLLSHDEGRTFGTILEALDDMGCDCQWQVCNSKNFGVPQNRERVIVVANLRERPRPKVLPIFGEERPHTEPQQDEQPVTQSIATRHLDRNGGLTSDLAPTVQVAEVPHIVTATGIGRYGRGDEIRGDGLAGTLKATGGGGTKNQIVVGVIDTRQGDGFRETDDLANTLTANYHKGHDNHGQRPMVRSKGARITDVTGVAPTLSSTDGGGSAGKPMILARNQRGELREMPISGTVPASQSAKQFQLVNGIRRLTPTECERLQALPDSWTAKGLRPDGSEYLISDTQRYKMCGNAVTTNVIEAVARKL